MYKRNVISLLLLSSLAITTNASANNNPVPSRTTVANADAQSSHSRTVIIHTEDNSLHSRTLVVQITSFDPAEANHGLLFALHALRDSTGAFNNKPYDLTVKIVFSGKGVLNASKNIKNPARIRFETRPEDPKKDTIHLIRALREWDVEMKATGFGLKQFGLSPKDLVEGVSGGGSKVIPRFITSPESNEVVVVTF